MTANPILCAWDGKTFTPLGKRWAKEADKYYTVGERYLMAEYHQRSQISHSHFFACVENAWANLQEEIAQNFPSPDHLRRWALIKTGFCNSQAFVAASKEEAIRLAAFIKPIDSFAIVAVKECSVIHYTAQSQSYRAMGKEEFQRSKDEVLRVISELIGADATTSPHPPADNPVAPMPYDTAEGKAEAPDMVADDLAGHLEALPAVRDLAHLEQLDAEVREFLKEADRADLLPRWNGPKLERERALRGRK